MNEKATAGKQSNKPKKMTDPWQQQHELQLQQQQQWLVEFEHRTHVFYLPPTLDDGSLQDALVEGISDRTGWPVSRLILVETDVHCARVRIQSSLLGGKGGFGTLLKSLARQSGAKLTTDFGACRDLQGRRLRHVNDEIKLRRWREAQESQKNGGSSADATDVMFDTPSGLYNWHLMVPSWADVSKKSTRKIQRQFRRMQQEEEKVAKEKQERKAQRERSVLMYVQKTTATANEVKSNVMNAVKQGLQLQKNKRKREEAELETPAAVFQKDDRPNSLCTLSGEVVVEETTKVHGQEQKQPLIQIQSQSDFSTLVLFLDKEIPRDKPSETILYYEVKLITGGLAQIGWADVMSKNSGFKPNTEEGDGVGDDMGSFGYDGSRSLKFHNGKEEVYPTSQWKAGDVVACQYNVKTGAMSYSLNGMDLGVAFTFPEASKTVLFPALSCNGGEILELHVAKEDMKHFPIDGGKDVQYIPVQEFIAVNLVESSTNEDHGDGADAQENDGGKAPATDKNSEGRLDAATISEHEVGDETLTEKTSVVEEKTTGKEKEPAQKKEPVKLEALDLDKFDSVADLEVVGLDRLKDALMAIGVKCGYVHLKAHKFYFWLVKISYSPPFLCSQWFVAGKGCTIVLYKRLGTKGLPQENSR
jgi:SPRY domain/Silencing defective 2 N-terminal ubiquitin domain/Replication stress response SDE2 C-terminal